MNARDKESKVHVSSQQGCICGEGARQSSKTYGGAAQQDVSSEWLYFPRFFSGPLSNDSCSVF